MDEFQMASPDPQLTGASPLPFSADAPEISATDSSKRFPRPWGPWATIGWTLLCVAAMFGGQIFGSIVFLILRIAVTGNPKIDDLGTNGNLLALATLFSTLAIVGLVAFLIWIRRYPLRATWRFVGRRHDPC